MYIIWDTQIFVIENNKKMLSNPVKSIFSYIIRPCSYNSVYDSAFQRELHENVWVYNDPQSCRMNK